MSYLEMRAIIEASFPADVLAKLDRKYHRPAAISKMTDEEFADYAFAFDGRSVEIKGRRYHG
jgi:hypothetical protein